MDATGKVNYSLWGKPVVLDTAVDMMFCMSPIWMAIAVGLIVGWSWKPRWVSLILLGLRSRPRLVWETPPGFGARRFWLAMTAVSALPMLKDACVKFSAWMWPSSQNSAAAYDFTEHPQNLPNCKSVGSETYKEPVTTEDLAQFMKMLDCTDGGPSWQQIMDRSVSGMTYQAYRRDPEVGPTQYRSRTVMEDVSPTMMRDFFWDNDFRQVWDDMLVHTKTLEECNETGAEIVHWVRKFPFYCKDREYIIGRRIWESNNTYYCITQGVHHPSVPRQKSPLRVDVYFSSWSIRAVESLRGDGQMTAVEVIVIHYEEMGIQRDLAKMGIRQGMWGCVKKLEPGIRKYKAMRKLNKPLTPSARIAQISTKVPYPLNGVEKSSMLETKNSIVVSGKGRDNESVEKNKGYMKWLLLGGAVAVACTVDRGAVGKFLVLGVAKRLGRVGRRM